MAFLLFLIIDARTGRDNGEAFLCRYWLENEISFAPFRNTPPPDAARQYIENYRRG
jgi:hypothetical protein